MPPQESAKWDARQLERSRYIEARAREVKAERRKMKGTAYVLQAVVKFKKLLRVRASGLAPAPAHTNPGTVGNPWNAMDLRA